MLISGMITWVDHNVGLKVKNLLEFTQRYVQQVADARRKTLEKPNVRAGACEFDVAQPLAANFRLCDLDTALVAHHSAVFHPLIFAAQTLPIGDRTEYLRAEQPIALRLTGPIVDRLRFGHLSM